MDSIADLAFFAVILLLLIPLFEWELWMLIWIGIIAVVRFLALGIGYLKYHAMTSIHTYANKATGIVLFSFPMLYLVAELPIAVSIICAFSTLSALDELAIIIHSKELDRNVASMFSRNMKLSKRGKTVRRCY